MMFAEYLEEREGKLTIVEPGKGFIVYKISGEVCHIAELFVRAGLRRGLVATNLADRVFAMAKDANCKIVTACVIPSTNGASEAMAAQLAYGFKIAKAMDDCIIMSKEI